jgi:hypothetical protein
MAPPSGSGIAVPHETTRGQNRVDRHGAYTRHARSRADGDRGICTWVEVETVNLLDNVLRRDLARAGFLDEAMMKRFGLSRCPSGRGVACHAGRSGVQSKYSNYPCNRGLCPASCTPLRLILDLSITDTQGLFQDKEA